MSPSGAARTTPPLVTDAAPSPEFTPSVERDVPAFRRARVRDDGRRADRARPDRAGCRFADRGSGPSSTNVDAVVAGRSARRIRRLRHRRRSTGAPARSYGSARAIRPSPRRASRLAASVETGCLYCADGSGRIVERSLSDGLATDAPIRPSAGHDRFHRAAATAGASSSPSGARPRRSRRWSTDGGGAVTRLIADGDAAYDGYGDGRARAPGRERDPRRRGSTTT